MNKRFLVIVGGLALVVVLAFGATAAVFAQTAGPNNGRGNYGQGSMMNGGAVSGQGGMMNGSSGSGQGGMMNGNGSFNGTTAQPLSIDEAKNAATKYLAGLNNNKLAIDEIMIFENNAYVAIKDTGTGVGAFELLVNPITKQAFPEYGPNMMWNLLYGHMSLNSYSNMGHGGNGGMMGGNAMMSGLGTISSSNYQVGKMPVTADQALQLAQTYLDKAYPGVKTTQKADEFAGYYTVDVQLNDKISGMLSVNGYTGQVWYHTWHGQFIQMVDYGA